MRSKVKTHFVLERKNSEIFEEFLSRIDNLEHQIRLEDILGWVSEKFPNLISIFKWN